MLKNSKPQLSPLFLSPVAAGFPSPADDFIERKLDLNEYLIRHPLATYFVRVSGNSMINAGIYDQDLLIVDRALNPLNNDIIIASLDGELTVKRIIKNQNKIYLKAENPDYSAIQILPESNFLVWGVVTYVLAKKR